MNQEPEQPLQPADFSPQIAPTDAAPPAHHHRPRWLLPALGVTTLLLFIVIFLLPAMIDTGDANVSPSIAAVAEAPGSPQSPRSVTATEERSPFAEAQLQKQRKVAQDALQEVLELQEILTDLDVTTWAPDAYADAVADADRGDAAYRARDFLTAASAYQAAAEQLTGIEQSIPSRIEDTLSTLTAAIEARDTAASEAALARLGTLSPADPRLDALSQRVAAIPGITRAIAAAASAAEVNDFANAISAIEEALEADPDHQYARGLLEDYQQADASQRFGRAMSRGYQALEEQDFDTAERAFKEAAGIRPGAPEPQSAMVELASARTASVLRQLQRIGSAAETAEAWGEAVTHYEQALAIDETLLFARQGLARSQPRAELARQLTAIEEQPDRLSDPRALRAAEQLLIEAKRVTDPGPVLRQQIATVASTLEFARTPIDVTLRSDGVTDVTLLRVKRLGSFTDTRITLRPGTYTAMGVRNGFRDVRVTFEVKPGDTPAVTVRCLEAI